MSVGSPQVAPRRSKAVIGIFLIFLSTIAGAWAWFHVRPPEASTHYRFEVLHDIPEWRFEPTPISPAVLELLATTNLFNGVFETDRVRKITVFAAEWRSRDARSMSVVQHTPDICWVGAGWTATRIGQPSEVELPLGPGKANFQCRAFKAPRGSQQELVLWCTLVGGEVLQETSRWSGEDNAAGDRTQASWAGRRVAAGQFLQNVRSRRAATAEKQFVRFSAPIIGDWQSTLEQLKTFAPHWLRLINTDSEH